MLKLVKVFARGVFTLAPFWWLWLGALMAVNVVLPLAYRSTLEARVVLAAVAIGTVIQFGIIARLGFVRLLGIGHVHWLLMVPWLASRLAAHGTADGFGKWLLAVVLIDSISLSIDVTDVTRWLRGERTPSVTLTDV